MTFSPNHFQVKNYTQAVRDYLKIVQQGKEGDGKPGDTRVIAGTPIVLNPEKDKAEAKQKAFEAMRGLQSLVRNPRSDLNAEDKREIAGTWKDFNRTFGVNAKPPQRLVLQKRPWTNPNYRGPVPVDVAHDHAAKGPKPVRTRAS